MAFLAGVAQYGIIYIFLMAVAVAGVFTGKALRSHKKA